MKKKKPKKPSAKTRKKSAWKAFSIYIRKSSADANGLSSCVSCGAIAHWTELQAGHFIDGRSGSVLFEENCVHPQCYRCNIALKGNKVEYYEYMLNKYGKAEIDRLRCLKFAVKKLSIDDYTNIEKDYTERTACLNAQ